MTGIPMIPPRGTPDVWDRIADSGKTSPLVMYGTGDGADKILDICDAHGIKISEIFASDGFVRDRSFRGYKIRSYEQIKQLYSDFTVILAFGSKRREVLDNIFNISFERTLYCPDVPVAAETDGKLILFDSNYYNGNYDAFMSLYSTLSDSESKTILALILWYKLTGDVKYLYSAVSETADGSDIIDFNAITSYADIGAYTGDTVRDAVAAMPSLRRIFAIEPDSRAYKKLSAYADTLSSDKLTITTLNAAAWDKQTTLTFISGGGRGSNISGGVSHRGEKSVTVNTAVPNLILPYDIDFIKYDVEGAEAEAISGTSVIKSESAPALLVSAYHKTNDLLALPAKLLSLYPGYSLYLRRSCGVPAWDINLFAIKNKL